MPGVGLLHGGPRPFSFAGTERLRWLGRFRYCVGQGGNSGPAPVSLSTYQGWKWLGQAMRGAGGSRTRFCGFADRRPAVRLRRHRVLRPSPGGPCPRQESNLVLDLRRVVCASVTPRGRRSKQAAAESPARESNPALRLRRPPCVRHTRGEGAECPRQESNLVFDLRRVACRPSHAKGAVEADGRTRTGMNLLTRQGPHRSATSAGAGAQGFEPCPRVLEARCSPRSTPL